MTSPNRELRFHLLNVFAKDDRLSGNPLCVFEDGDGLSDPEMQALARQFNLSETTFICKAKSNHATRRVRIFTPTAEMPFAGHPTLGTAHVVRDLLGCGDRVVLEMLAGLVGVIAESDMWTLQTARAPKIREPEASRQEFAAMLDLPEAAILEHPMWVDTGVEQLLIPLATEGDLDRARPTADLLGRFG